MAPVGALARRGLDPRSKILLVLLVSLTVMSPGGLVLVPAGILLATGLAATERAWSRAVLLPVTAVVMYLLGWVLPLVWTNPAVTVVAIGCGYLIRFVAAFGVGAHLIATTSPTQLSAALRAWRLPRALSVTLAVMLRFFPVVAAESAAVLDAMRLRGLAGTTGLARHPILGMERFTVPMIAASLRASEDLSASAILRGLGSRRRPVSLDPPRFGRPDLVLVLAVIVLATAGLLLPNPLTTVIA
ncbi:energy-coupling factor transporter transmembrane component T [Leucobacter sp.]